MRRTPNFSRLPRSTLYGGLPAGPDAGLIIDDLRVA
jgi:hypothetical protein